METVRQIQDKLDEMINGVVDGSIQIRQANAVGRLVREKTRLYYLRHKSAEAQNRLDQLNTFYGIADSTNHTPTG